MVSLVAPNVMDKVRKEKDELRDLNSQLKCHISDRKTSMPVLKENLMSCSHQAKIAENQTENLILQDLQGKLNSHLCRMSIVKVRALIGKEWDPESWKGDAWKDFEEAPKF